MIDILKTVLPSPEQMEMVVEGLHNPMNSWDKSDSYSTHAEDELGNDIGQLEFFIGENDLQLMGHLAACGPVHAKYRRMMPVFVTINAPLYWWKEFDLYRVGTVITELSIARDIREKPFALEDFSCEKLGYYDCENDEQAYVDTAIDGCADVGGMVYPTDILTDIISSLNHNRDKFLETYDYKYWHQIVQLLPASYNQTKTIMLNYEDLHSLYILGRENRLDEFKKFCEWIEDLPYSELITASYHEPVFAES